MYRSGHWYRGRSGACGDLQGRRDSIRTGIPRCWAVAAATAFMSEGQLRWASSWIPRPPSSTGQQARSMMVLSLAMMRARCSRVASSAAANLSMPRKWMRWRRRDVGPHRRRTSSSDWRCWRRAIGADFLIALSIRTLSAASTSPAMGMPHTVRHSSAPAFCRGVVPSAGVGPHQRDFFEQISRPADLRHARRSSNAVRRASGSP